MKDTVTFFDTSRPYNCRLTSGSGLPFLAGLKQVRKLDRHSVKYREITAADVPALFNVRTRTRENAYTHQELHALGITIDSVTEKLATSFKGWLCTDADQVVAFCMADRSTGELWVIAVLPEYEGKGIGGRLMSSAEAWLWSSGFAQAWLTTDVDIALRAYGFYRHRGWTDWRLDNGLRWMRLLLPRRPNTWREHERRAPRTSTSPSTVISGRASWSPCEVTFRSVR